MVDRRNLEITHLHGYKAIYEEEIALCDMIVNMMAVSVVAFLCIISVVSFAEFATRLARVEKLKRDRTIMLVQAQLLANKLLDKALNQEEGGTGVPLVSTTASTTLDQVAAYAPHMNYAAVDELKGRKKGVSYSFHATPLERAKYVAKELDEAYNIFNTRTKLRKDKEDKVRIEREMAQQELRMIDMLENLRVVRSEMLRWGFRLGEADFIEFVNFNTDVLKKLRKTYDVFDNRVKFLDREQQFIEEYKSRKTAFIDKVVKRKDIVKLPDPDDVDRKMREIDLKWHKQSLIGRDMHELYRIGGAYISTTPWSILHSPAIERLVQQNVKDDKWEPVRDFEVFVNNPKGVKWASVVGNQEERDRLIRKGEAPETECLLMSYHYPLCGLATQISIKMNKLSHKEVARRQIGLQHDVFDLC